MPGHTLQQQVALLQNIFTELLKTYHLEANSCKANTHQLGSNKMYFIRASNTSKAQIKWLYSFQFRWVTLHIEAVAQTQYRNMENNKAFVWDV